MGGNQRRVHGDSSLESQVELTEMNILRATTKINVSSTRPFIMGLFNPQPIEDHVGTCPIYGHKYYETRIQKYGFRDNWEITVDKRRVEWNADYGTFGKVDPSQQHLLIQEIMQKRLYTVEWERCIRSKRVKAPTDQEIAINTIKKNDTAAKGKALENKYKANSGVAASGNEQVHNPVGRDEDGKYQYEGQTEAEKEQFEYEYKDVHLAASEQYEIYKDASSAGENFKEQGHTSYKKSYVGAQNKDGIEAADVHAWDPNAKDDK